MKNGRRSRRDPEAGPERRRSGLPSDILNTALFLVALALLLATLAIMDPTVKKILMRILP